MILRDPELHIVGCGRTDTGVHAKKYYAHVDMYWDQSIDLVHRLNRVLSKEIAILNIHSVTSDAHARFDAQERTYQYKIHFDKNPFYNLDSVLLNKKPDIEPMNMAAQQMIGVKDFACFAKVDHDAKTTICDVQLAEWTWQNDQLIFMIRANRFLRNMVRAVVGTLLEVGYGKLSQDCFLEVLASKDRNQAGTSAPANGLALYEIKYPFEL